MPLVVTGKMESVLSDITAQGRIVIEHWGLGVGFKNGVYVLNLYSQGQNYPEIIADSAVAGVIQLLALAQSNGLQILYWPNATDSVLFVGKFSATK